jgi:hypothetical protein
VPFLFLPPNSKQLCELPKRGDGLWFGTPANWIAADILRIEDGVLVEHWDVIQDEATRGQSKSGKPMFGDSFPVYR